MPVILRSIHAPTGDRPRRAVSWIGNACFSPGWQAGTQWPTLLSTTHRMPAARARAGGGATRRPRPHRARRLRGRSRCCCSGQIHTVDPEQRPPRRRGRRPRRPPDPDRIIGRRPPRPRPAQQVPVLVANASGVNGAAGAVTTQLQPGGWDLLPRPTPRAQVPTSNVYYVAGFRSPRPRPSPHRCSCRPPRSSRTPRPPRSAPSGRPRCWWWSGPDLAAKAVPTTDHDDRRLIVDGRDGPEPRPAGSDRSARGCAHGAGPTCLVHPAATAIVTDFDGTLSPIVDGSRRGPTAGRVPATAGAAGPPVRRGGGGLGPPGLVSGRAPGCIDPRSRCRGAPARLGRPLRARGGEARRPRSTRSRRRGRGDRSVDGAVARLRPSAPGRGPGRSRRVWPSPSTGGRPPTPRTWATAAVAAEVGAKRAPGPSGSHVARAATPVGHRQGLGDPPAARGHARRPATSGTTSATCRPSPPWPSSPPRTGWRTVAVAVVDDESDARGGRRGRRRRWPARRRPWPPC